MDYRIILVSGKQGSGKSTLQAQLRLLLAERGWSVEFVNFADPLYQMHDACRQILRARGRMDLVQPKDGNLLQLLGTDWGRKHLGENVWVDLLKSYIAIRSSEFEGRTDKLVFIVGDCRFENEFRAFPTAVSVRLECDKEVRRSRVSMWRENDTHPSETGLDHLALDFQMQFDTEFDPPDRIARAIIQFKSF